MKCPLLLNGRAHRQWRIPPGDGGQHLSGATDSTCFRPQELLFKKPAHTCTTAGYSYISVYNKDHSEFTQVVIDKSLPAGLCVTSLWEYRRSHFVGFFFLYVTIDGMWCNSPLCSNPIGMCINPFFLLPASPENKLKYSLCRTLQKAKADYAQRESLTSRSIVCRTDLLRIFSNDFGNGELIFSLSHFQWACTNVVMLIWLGHLPGSQK